MNDALPMAIGMLLCTAIGLYFGVTMGEANVVVTCDEKKQFTLDRKLYLPVTITCERIKP